MNKTGFILLKLEYFRLWRLTFPTLNYWQHQSDFLCNNRFIGHAQKSPSMENLKMRDKGLVVHQTVVGGLEMECVVKEEWWQNERDEEVLTKRCWHRLRMQQWPFWPESWKRNEYKDMKYIRKESHDTYLEKAWSPFQSISMHKGVENARFPLFYSY